MTKGITFHTLGPEDGALLAAIPEGLFDAAIDPQQAAAFLADPGHVLVLAFVGDFAVGMATGTVLLHPDKPPALFVNEVGVREDWQRRGIATALMERLIALAGARGCEGIWLGTELDNVAARALYLKAGGTEDGNVVLYGWDGALDRDQG